ncbi:DUF4269 domain-containing protein [Halalkalibacter okhensis]|uniref:Alpha/beta hydrolase n=1 Tax=Halalkalibacter okhensis TaxID=333138 RepID=A0A0B0IJX4_9BACI|nr:DUF4269 domain-containing protein [Halalkalibacter okhensis]KHF39961.1 alpha/beta hydrolase [Halalkalibacter okhensis]
MFDTIEYLNSGNSRQKRAFSVISELKIMSDLVEFTPILCGTVPIEIDIEGSDLDIIMEVKNFTEFERKIRLLYGGYGHFSLSKKTIKNVPVIKANFHYQNFEFELFGQDESVFNQNAYLHMVIENYVLKQSPDLQGKIIELKKQGFKTEPAFCKVLHLPSDDPYLRLLEYGKINGII